MEIKEVSPLSEEEERWNAWLDHPCTNMLRQWASAKRFDYMSQWAGGSFADNPDADAVGRGCCFTLSDIMELDFTKINEELSDAKQFGFDASR